MRFLQAIKTQVLVLDGATGTMIQDLGLGDEDFGGPDFRMCSDLLCFSRPGGMRDIHLAYLRAGANAIETNTFGASPLRLGEYDFSKLDLAHFEHVPYDIDLRRLTHEEFAYYLSRRGAEIAVEAVEQYAREPAYDGRPLFVVGSIGPSNRVVSNTKATLARATFDEIADNFYRQVLGLVDGGAQVLLFETQQDVLETKAAVWGGVRAMTERGARLPILCQVTVDQFGKMQIFNTDIHAALVTLQDIGIDAFGINCSIGPDLMEKTVEKIARYSPLPISVVPNAGLPVSENGRTVFRFPPEEFARIQRRFVEEYGVTIVGGCCGTTPEHIRVLAREVGGLTPRPRSVEPGLFVSGPQEAVPLDSSKALIRFGERLNVRGSKKVRDAVESGAGIDHDALEEVIREQVNELGCEVIDVCMDSNVVETASALKEVVHVQTTDFKAAMCLDSFEVRALADAIKVYPGRPVVNSISMEEYEPGVPKVDAVIEATRFHAPLYVGLCTGPGGPGATADEKVALARQIIARARDKHGVAPGRLLIDVNVFPIGSESEEGMNFAAESLEAIRRVKELCPETHAIVGVGNLTNGLQKKPYMRTVLTSVFLDEARKRGLDAAIINPNHYVFVRDLDPSDYELGLRVVLERDMDAFAELETIAEAKKGVAVQKRVSYDDLPAEKAITEKVKDGFKQREKGAFEFKGRTYEYHDRIVLQVAEAIARHAPLDFINEYLMGAMQELGDGFGRGEVSLPHLLKSADVMRACMGFLEAYMRHESGIDVHSKIEYKGTVVVGTVYQDVHSIGKDLARTLLENYGYRVIDLGTMTPLQRYLDAAKEHHADAIGMSALLVQTSNHMITVSKMMLEQGLGHLHVLVGGAPVSDRHAAFVAMAGQDDPAQMRGNVFYCRTAMDGVNVMNRLCSREALDPYLEANKAKLVRRLEHAQQRAAREEALLQTLPRRVVSFNGRQLPPEPRFRLRRVDFSLREFAAHIDRKTLYSLNWRFGGASSRERKGHSLEQLNALFDEWTEKAARNDWVRAQGVFGIYPCQSEGDTLILFDPDQPGREVARLDFTTVIGAGNEDLVSGAQYFDSRQSGVVGACGVQLSSSGPNTGAVLDEFRATGDSESLLYLQGLSDRTAEDMADYLHQLQRELLGVPEHCGTRWSPGYPGMTNITNNRVIHELLDGAAQIGVRLTDACEFQPTGTTGAIVSFHPDARYN
ncbi:MAG: homocysteine S-methyltransferase family protein [Candidatus Hydrogenedentes bacterium]|nr:homocysteine S-methyltransferase family protein [Candidatus Hydrogenedentota bacterium]